MVIEFDDIIFVHPLLFCIKLILHDYRRISYLFSIGLMPLENCTAHTRMQNACQYPCFYQNPPSWLEHWSDASPTLSQYILAIAQIASDSLHHQLQLSFLYYLPTSFSVSNPIRSASYKCRNRRYISVSIADPNGLDI